MPTLSGIITGLMGYSLKKEMLSDSFFYRETQTFKYEAYSVDFVGMSPKTIQDNIYKEFNQKYSGDINIKVFNQPAEYFYTNDSIRAAKFNVEVQVRSVPDIETWQPELDGSASYSGIESSFWKSYGDSLLDFKENFDFEKNEGGVKTFLHNVSFGLITGNRQKANAIASGIFSKDKDTSFGISSLVAKTDDVANSSKYRNYYSETFDTIRGTYSFSRKRDILPVEASSYIYNLSHSMDIKEDGIIDVIEKGNVKGQLTFAQAQDGAEILIAGAYPRCSGFYSDYSNLLNNFSVATTAPLINLPTKVLRVLNHQAITNDYEVAYTNNPQFKTDGTIWEETIDLNETAVGIMDVKHNFSFTRNKRTTADSKFFDLISGAIVSSPTTIDSYLAAVYSPIGWPMHLIKKEIGWPNKKNKGARVSLNYNNHPKYFVTLDGQLFNQLDYKISHTKPVDITTEYKVINRPSKTSVINYAYQTERGQLTITIDAGIGRTPNEFVSGFRSDIGAALYKLYQFAITIFFNNFKDTVPLAFTYYLQDVKYSHNSEVGSLQLVTTFSYSIKKYTE